MESSSLVEDLHWILKNKPTIKELVERFGSHPEIDAILTARTLRSIDSNNFFVVFFAPHYYFLSNDELLYSFGLVYRETGFDTSYSYKRGYVTRNATVRLTSRVIDPSFLDRDLISIFEILFKSFGEEWRPQYKLEEYRRLYNVSSETAEIVADSWLVGINEKMSFGAATYCANTLTRILESNEKACAVSAIKHISSSGQRMLLKTDCAPNLAPYFNNSDAIKALL